LVVAAVAAVGLARAEVEHSIFDAILRDNVRDERVDYLHIRLHALARLDEYLDRMADADADALTRDERLAYCINVYNATTIRAVVERYRLGYSVSEDSFVLFKDPIVHLRGGSVSLNHLENEIIRKQFDDPRIHAALVCAAASCPPLLARAYRADDLDAVLDANMRRFVNDPARNHIAPGRVELSKIFEWYAEDFGGKDRLTHYVAKYATADVRDARQSFLEYSWELNMAPPTAGEWVAIVADGADLFSNESGGEPSVRATRGEVFLVLDQSGEMMRVQSRQALSCANSSEISLGRI